VRIIIAPETATVALEDPDDFTAFSVSAPADAEAALSDRLGALGDYDGHHAWVDREALADLAGERAADPAWREGLSAMVDYARAEGFLSEDESAIRAHVEWVG
jgi:hypothetical protein